MPKKKKSRKQREEGGEGKKKGKGKASAADSDASTPAAQANGGAYIEEVETSGDSRPVSRGARVEDAPEDDE